MSRNTAAAISIFLTIFLIGCAGKASMPLITPSPARKTAQPASTRTTSTQEPAVFPTVTPTVTPSPAYDWVEVLRNAVADLQRAASFELSTRDVRAYRVIEVNSPVRLVYGEFNSTYVVIRDPTLKVHGSFEYRYDPQAEFIKYESYAYQEEEKVYTRLVEDSVGGVAEEIDPKRLEPFAGDVYQTLVTYHDQAELMAERDGMAIYHLEHPAWYKLNGAIGFANLGFLHQQDKGEQLIEQYVADRYPNVKTILFTITVDIEKGLIVKVEVDDRDFMTSLWQEVDRALLEQGADAGTLTRYEVMDVNRAEYLFSNYNRVQAFEIPE